MIGSAVSGSHCGWGSSVKGGGSAGVVGDVGGKAVNDRRNDGTSRRDGRPVGG